MNPEATDVVPPTAKMMTETPRNGALSAAFRTTPVTRPPRDNEKSMSAVVLVPVTAIGWPARGEQNPPQAMSL